jgi:hypothetical protein
LESNIGDSLEFHFFKHKTRPTEHVEGLKQIYRQEKEPTKETLIFSNKNVLIRWIMKYFAQNSDTI